MHELPVTQSILEIALRHAATAGAVRITSLHLVIGQFASIVDDSVQFYWDLIAENTLAQGARLNFRRIPAQMECRECEHRFAPSDETFACPSCGSPHVRVSAGEEFFLESIDIETAST